MTRKLDNYAEAKHLADTTINAGDGAQTYAILAHVDATRELTEVMRDIANHLDNIVNRMPI